MSTEVVDPHFVAVDEAGKPADPQDLAALNDNNIAYDPTQMTVDLTKAEKRRTTALMLAIQAYQHLIIKDADMFRAVSQEHARNNGPVILPATMDAMVAAAIDFDRFIEGKFDIDDLEPQQPTAEEPAS